MFRFEELEIWKLAISYAQDCYQISFLFPKQETYALSDQLKRASISISNNIAEGSVEQSATSFKHYLNIAIGSTLETVNILYFAASVRYINEQKRLAMYEKAEKLIRKMRNFSKSLK